MPSSGGQAWNDAWWKAASLRVFFGGGKQKGGGSGAHSSMRNWVRVEFICIGFHIAQNVIVLFKMFEGWDLLQDCQQEQ